MKDNRHKWLFLKQPSRSPLSPQDVKYWLDQFTKILKIGIEFELNLPEGQGSCNGENLSCPCANMANNCWEVCISQEACKEKPLESICANAAACENQPKQCEACPKFIFKCLGPLCLNFTSKCFICADFLKKCETCEKRYDPNKDPKQVRKLLKDELRPSSNYGCIGKYGVVSITTDGSLLGGQGKEKGVEIITVGRRINYWEFYKMCDTIINTVQKYKAYPNERCSSHMHILTSHYDQEGMFINELERDIPELILANHLQLCRRYQNAITWMTMALEDHNHLTRWEKFRISVLEFTPVPSAMHNIVHDIMSKSQSLTGKDKYGWVNYKNMGFNNRDISRFHLEMRVADSTFCPSYYAALACLFQALVIKAIEISAYGLLKIGDDDWLNANEQIRKTILNGTGDYGNDRLSDTSKYKTYQALLIEESTEMLSHLKHILLKLGPAYDVLMRLAKEPVALRRTKGDTWPKIEAELEVKINEVDKFELKLQEIIDLQAIEACKNMDEWVNTATKMVNEDAKGGATHKDKVSKYVERRSRDGEIIWSDSLGTILAI